MRTLRLRPESAGAWWSPPGRGVCTFPRVIRSPSPWRPGRPDTSACPRASGLWLGFRGARRHAVPVVVAAAVICRSISWLHSAPSRGSTAAHRLPSAGSTGPAWPRAVRARPLGTGGHFRCVLGIRQRKRWLQSCLTWTALPALVNLAPPHDVKSCALVLGIRGGEDA